MSINRRSVFLKVTPTMVYHSLEAQESDEVSVLAFQSENLNIYVTHKKTTPIGKRWAQVGNAANQLCVALGDHPAYLRDVRKRNIKQTMRKDIRESSEYMNDMFGENNGD